jgi:hypothetical protein
VLELDKVRCEEFGDCLNENFTVAAQSSGFILKLSEVRPLGPRSGTDREPFSVTFLGPGGLRLPQAIYKLNHPRLGEMEIFLVQIAADRDSSSFEAVFN